MVSPAHDDVVGIRLTPDILTNLRCRVCSVLLSCKEQKRLVHGNGPNIRVHAGKAGAVQVYASQNAAFLLCGQCGCRSTERVASDSNPGQIEVALPEMIMRIHFPELVENEFHVCHQHLVCKLANGHALRSIIGFNGPVGRKFE